MSKRARFEFFQEWIHWPTNPWNRPIGELGCNPVQFLTFIFKILTLDGTFVKHYGVLVSATILLLPRAYGRKLLNSNDI